MKKESVSFLVSYSECQQSKGWEKFSGRCDLGWGVTCLCGDIATPRPGLLAPASDTETRPQSVAAGTGETEQ